MRRAICSVAALLVATTSAFAQAVGDHVRLESVNAAGVPVHPAAGDQRYVRWANGTVGWVEAIDPPTGWYRVGSTGGVGWVTRRYITVVPPEEPESPGDSAEIPAYVVGTWNLEWLKDGKKRGFPEYFFGGPTYGPRSDQDYRDLAQVIAADLEASILVLTEIHGEDNGTSTELDRLVGHLGTGWSYELGRSGAEQRVAILFHAARARMERCEEFEVPRQEVGGKDIFARDPLACLFTFLSPSGEPRNDLVVVGLHLASGQHLSDNHDMAMEILRELLHAAWEEGVFPPGEGDLLIAGDLNASRYDLAEESFWTGYDAARFAFETLAPEDPTEYPGTRLAGVPLYPRSQIDYLIASGAPGGLGDELVQRVGHVHTELLSSDFTEFRRKFSDHLPVTVRILVESDDDP